ncbi:MAG TPA: DMT family transporter [Acidimicrobiales bacterium]|jgi:drug/metabolite transporter (DMT)-like permease
MAALLALSAAVAYGVGDFFGGMAARRESPTVVVLWSHVVGLVLLLAAAPLVAGEPSPRVLAIGAASGLIGGAGVALFYRALAVGRMSVVAPVAALLSAVVPVVAGLIDGERPTPAALAGIALALGAIVLISRDTSGDGAKPIHWQALALAVAAGLAFGLFFVVVGHAGEGAGIWPLVGARAASISLFAALGAARITAAAPPQGAIAAIVACGLLDASANVFFLLALNHGLMSVVAVLTALYPAGTVLLARYVLGEELSRVQRVGLGVAGVAAVLIAY